MSHPGLVGLTEASRDGGRAMRAYLGALLDYSDEALLAFDADGHTLLVRNAAASRFLGWDADAVEPQRSTLPAVLSALAGGAAASADVAARLLDTVGAGDVFTHVVGGGTAPPVLVAARPYQDTAVKCTLVKLSEASAAPGATSDPWRRACSQQRRPPCSPARWVARHQLTRWTVPPVGLPSASPALSDDVFSTYGVSRAGASEPGAPRRARRKSMLVRTTRPDAIWRLIADPDAEKILLASESLSSWDAFELAKVTKHRPLATFALWSLQRSGLLAHFRIPQDRLMAMIGHIESCYPDNPYHNRVHATDVMRSIHFLLTATPPGILDEEQRLALYIGAAAHDVEHGGVTNGFLCATDVRCSCCPRHALQRVVTPAPDCRGLAARRMRARML